MPVAIDASTPAIKSAGDTTPAFIDSNSFTPPAGSRIWLCVGWDAGGSQTPPTISSATGPSLTWNLANDVRVGGGKAWVWWANVSSSTSYVIRVDLGTVAFPGCCVLPLVVTGGETTPPAKRATTDVGLNTAGTIYQYSVGGWVHRTQSIGLGTPFTPTQTGSILICVTTGWSGGTQWVADTNQTSLGTDRSATNYQCIITRLTGTTTQGVAVNMGVTAAGSSESGDMAIVEIREGAAGGTPRSGWGRVSI